MKRLELLVFMLTGKIIAIVGGVGAVITMLFDQIARGTPICFGWLQITGLIGFITLGLFGLFADVVLNETIKPMIEEAYGKL